MCLQSTFFSSILQGVIKKTEEVLAKIDDTKPNGWTKVGSLIFWQIKYHILIGWLVVKEVFLVI